MPHEASVTAQLDGNGGSRPYLPGIAAILRVAVRQIQASGWAYHEWDAAAGEYVCRASHNLTVAVRPAQTGAAENGDLAGGAVTNFAVNGGGIEGYVHVSYAAGRRRVEDRWRRVLQQTAASIEALLEASSEASRMEALTNRIYERQAELISRKIIERAEGLLGDPGCDDWSDALHRHVKGVLKFQPLPEILSQQLQEVEQRLEARDVIAAAKSALRARDGLTEEQAYRYLREESRNSREPLTEVARRVLGGDAPHRLAQSESSSAA